MPWSGSNADYFTRNILTYVPPYWATGLGETDVDELLANICATNGPKAPWPTERDVRAWAEIDGHPDVSGTDSTNPQALVWATRAAVSRIATLKGLPVLPVDADGAVDPEGDPVEIEPHVWLAVVMQAARWYRRDDISGELDGDVAVLLEEPPSL